jgi:hypothetical protein
MVKAAALMLGLSGVVAAEPCASEAKVRKV